MRRLTSAFTQSRKSFSTSVYLWSQQPRLGSKTSSAKVKFEMPKGTPTRIEEFDNLDVKILRVGMRHSAVVTKSGELYTFGSGNWGALGHGDENHLHHKLPKRVEKLVQAGVKVKDVQLGEYQTTVLGEDGSVWTWGYGGKKGFFNWMYTQEVGALGHNTVDSNFQPKRIEFFKQNNIKIKSISAGSYHCVALTENDDMYNWGRGLYGVLGNGSNQYSLVPQLNEEFNYFKEQLDPEERAQFGFR